MRALLLVFFAAVAQAAPPEQLFKEAATNYYAGDYPSASDAFRQVAALQPASGTLQNLGNAEWQRGQAGLAILAWEQALWLDPLNRSAHGNLRFARKMAQLEAPELTWYEVVSTWLPADWWGWIAGVSLWLAVGMVLMPGILRCPKAAWQQAVAALGLAVFLLSIPAHFGVYTRSRLGFILEKDTPLRLTPTADAEAVTQLAAGDPARLKRVRGDFVLVQTSHSVGWLEKRRFGLVCSGY
jgi:tetratricopeptide (TPR) repeat protein